VDLQRVGAIGGDRLLLRASRAFEAVRSFPTLAALRAH
jgi:hypothetical protein